MLSPSSDLFSLHLSQKRVVGMAQQLQTPLQFLLNCQSSEKPEREHHKNLPIYIAT
jgi:hypothetical protein